MAAGKPVNPNYVPDAKGTSPRRVPTTEIRPAWETSAFPDWVNYTFIPLFTAGEPWPVDTKAVELGRAAQLFDSMVDNLGGAVEKTVPAVSAINAGYTSPAKPPAFTHIRRQFDDRTGVIAKANQGAQFAERFASFALETDLTKRSINIAFWVSITAAALGIVAVSSPFAALVVRLSAQMGSVRAQLLMQRLLLVASRMGPATAGGRTVLAGSAAGRYAQWELMTELPEEIMEELASEKAQYDQIKEGLRDKWDWQRTKAILIGTIIGTVSGVWIGRHMRGYIDRLPGIRSLNRMAGDRTGVLPALQRYPGAVLATALPNVPGSMLGQVGAGLAVYGDPGEFTLQSMVGAAAAGGFRANTYSPFNLQVMGAAVHPITTLSNYAASVGTHLAGTAPMAGPDGSGPATADGQPPTGGQPSAGGPRPTGPDGAAAQQHAPQPVVPLQRAVSDLSVPATRDGSDVTQQRSPAVDPQRTPTADPSKPHRQGAPDQPAVTAQAERNGTAPASHASQNAAAPTSTQPSTPDQRANGQRTPDQAQTREPATTQDERQAPPPAQAAQPQSQTARPQGQAQAAPSPNAQVQSQTTAEPNTAPAHPQTAQNGQATQSGQTAQSSQAVQNGQAAAATVMAAVSPVTLTGPAAQSDPGGPAATDPAVARLSSGPESRSDYTLVTSRPMGRSQKGRSKFVVRRRPPGTPKMTVDEVRTQLLTNAPPSVIAGVNGWTWNAGDDPLVVHHTTLGDLHFRVQRPGRLMVRRHGRRLFRPLARTKVRSGTAEQPHLLRPHKNVASDQLARVVVHEISDTLQAVEARRNGVHTQRRLPPHHEAGLDFCLRSRLSEYNLLTLQLSRATTEARRAEFRTEIDVLVAERLHHSRTPPGKQEAAPARSSPETPIDPHGREEGDEALRRGRRIAAEMGWDELPDRLLRQVGEVQALYGTGSRTHPHALRNAEFDLGGRRGVYATARLAVLANDAGVREALDGQDPNALTSALVKFIHKRDFHLTAGRGIAVLAETHGLTDQELRAIGRLHMRFGLAREGALEPAVARLIQDRGLANTLEAYLDLERKGAYSSLDQAEDPASWLAAYMNSTGDDRRRLVGGAVGRIGNDPYPEDSWVHLGRLAEIAGPELFGGRLRSFKQGPLYAMADSRGLLRVIDMYLDAVWDGYRPVIDATTPDQLADALSTRPPARQARERDIRALLARKDAMNWLAGELSMTPWLVEMLLWAAHEHGQLVWEADGVLRHGRFTERIAHERLKAVRPEHADRWLSAALANALGHELTPGQIRALIWVAQAHPDIRTPEGLMRPLKELADVAGLPASPDVTPAVLDAIIQGHDQGTISLRPSWENLKAGLHPLAEPLRPRSTDLDPDTRPPLLPLHDEKALAALRDGDAYALDPRKALRASQWADLRRLPGMPVNERPEWNLGMSSLELRRLNVLDEAGTTHPITEFTLLIWFRAPDLSRAELLREQSSILDAVDFYYNHQHRLRDGSQLHLRVELAEAKGDQPAVLLRPDAGKRSDATHFDAGKQLSFYAHEIGHHLGLPDEYKEETRHGRRTLTDSLVQRDRTLMGSDRLFWALSPFTVRSHQGLQFPDPVGLRHRHLESLSDLAETMEVTVPGPDSSHSDSPRTETRPRDLPIFTGPAGPAVPDETTRLPVPTAENTRLPDRVLKLLKKFPVSGPEFFQHALRLDRMAALHQDIPLSRLKRHHLAYTDALISTATAMYDATPGYRFDRPELTRLRTLLDLVADRDGVTPDAHTLIRRLAEAMGVDRPQARDMEGLTRFAEWFRATGGQRFPGEQGVQALRRAAGELFGDVESTRAVVEVAQLFATAAESSESIASGEAGARFSIVAAAIRDALLKRAPGETLTGDDLAKVVNRALAAAQSSGPAAGQATPPGSDATGSTPLGGTDTDTGATGRSRPYPGTTAYAPESPIDPLTGRPVRGAGLQAGRAGLPDGAVAFHHDPAGPAGSARRGDSAADWPARPRSTDLDPDTRPPLLPLYDEKTLAALRDGNAYALDPREALRASQWAGLRRLPAEMIMEREERKRVLSLLEVRRLRVIDEAGTPHPITEFTLLIRFRASGLSRAEVLREQSNILDSVDLYYNHQHRLRDGSQLHLRVEFVEATGNQPAILLRPRTGERPDYAHFDTGLELTFYAHELGHHLEFLDEYVDQAEYGSRTLTSDYVRLDRTLMGSTSLFWAFSRTSVRDHEGIPFAAPVGLRHRHLESLSDLAETREVTVPRRRDSRFRSSRIERRSRDLPIAVGPAGPAVPAGTMRPPLPTAENVRLPDHVRELLKKFPVSGPEFFQHALRLDRMAALHQDIPLSRLKRHHLAYTDALISTAVSIYATDADYPFARAHLARFRTLLDLVADRDGALPDAPALIRRLTDAIDSDRIFRRDVEGLARFAEWFRATGGQRFPGEQGVGALRRAAGELFGDVESTQAVVEVAKLFAAAAESSELIASGEAGARFDVVADAIRDALLARAPGETLTGYDLVVAVENAITTARSSSPVTRDGPAPPGSDTGLPDRRLRRLGEIEAVLYEGSPAGFNARREAEDEHGRPEAPYTSIDAATRQQVHEWLAITEYDQLLQDLRGLQAADPELIRSYAPGFVTRPEGVVALRAFTAGHATEINAAIIQGARPGRNPIAGSVAEMWAAWRQLPPLAPPVSFWLDLTPQELGAWTGEPEFMLREFMLVTAQPAHPATRVPEGRVRHRFDFDVASARELGPITWQAGFRQVMAAPGTRLSVTYVAEERRIVLSDGHTAPPPALTPDTPPPAPAAQDEVSADAWPVPPPSAPRPGRGADDWVALPDVENDTLRLYRRLDVPAVLSAHVTAHGTLYVLRGADWYQVELVGGLRLSREDPADLPPEMTARARQQAGRYAASGTLYDFRETMHEEPGQRSMRHPGGDVIATFYGGFLGSLHLPVRGGLLAPLLKSATALDTLVHPATGLKGVRVVNGWMEFTVLEDISVVDAEIRPVDLTPELVGLPRTEAVREPTGFIRGGVNDNATIAGLDRFGGTSRAGFEERLRESGLLGSTEDVRDVLVRDNTLVLGAKLTHADLARPLHLADRVLQFVDHARIRIGGHEYDVRTVPPSGTLKPDTMVEVVNVTTGERMTLDTGSADMISSHGFYGGRRSPDRLAPEQIIRVFTHLNERLPADDLRQLVSYADRNLERPSGVVAAAATTPPDARAPELPALPDPVTALPAGLRPLVGRFAGNDSMVIEFGDGGRRLFARLGRPDEITGIHVDRRSVIITVKRTPETGVTFRRHGVDHRTVYITVKYRTRKTPQAGWSFGPQGTMRWQPLPPGKGFARPSERNLRDLGFQPLADDGRTQIMRFTHDTTTVLAVLNGRRLTGLYSSVSLTPSQQRLVDVATIHTDAGKALGLDVNGLPFDLQVLTDKEFETRLVNSHRASTGSLSLDLPPVSSSEPGRTVTDEAARIERSLRSADVSPAHLPGFRQLGATPLWRGGPFVLFQRLDSGVVLYRQVTDAPEDLREVHDDGAGLLVRAGADSTLAIKVYGQGDETLYQRVSPLGADLIGGSAEGVRLTDALAEWTIHPEEPHFRDLVVHAGLDTVQAALDAAPTGRLDDVRTLERQFAYQVTEGWRTDVPGVLRHDDHLVLVEGVTHAQLALPLRLIRHLDDALPGFDRVTLGGQEYAVRRETPSPLRSPFGDLLNYSPDYVVTNLADGTELRFAGRAGDLIATHGFYGDNTHAPRLDPQDIKTMFPSVLPSDAGISGLLPGTAAEPRPPGGDRLGASPYWRGLSRLVMRPDGGDPVLYLKRELNFSYNPVTALEVDPAAEGGPALLVTFAQFHLETYRVPMGEVRASARRTSASRHSYSRQSHREQLESAGFHVVHTEDDLRILRYAWSGGEMLAVFVGDELDGLFSREPDGTSNRIDRLINGPRRDRPE